MLSRCFHHADREAIARCPECFRSYCRECITEHDDRVLCASCLQKKRIILTKTSSLSFWEWTQQAVFLACSLLLLWVAFYFAGRLLLKIPSEYHDGTIWKKTFQMD